jgi:hypothetical protein
MKPKQGERFKKNLTMVPYWRVVMLISQSAFRIRRTVAGYVRSMDDYCVGLTYAVSTALECGGYSASAHSRCNGFVECDQQFTIEVEWL